MVKEITEDWVTPIDGRIGYIVGIFFLTVAALLILAAMQYYQNERKQ